MDPLIDISDLIHAPTQISSTPRESESPEPGSANGPTEENLAHNQSTLVEVSLQAMKSTSRRSRRRMRTTNPHFTADNLRGQSK